MASGNSEGPKSWIFKWIMQESFWENVASQTLATLIAALFITLVAVFVGVSYSPDVRFALLLGVVYSVAIAVIQILIILEVRYLNRKMDRSRFNTFMIVAIVLITYAVGTFVLLLISPLLAQLIAGWTGYS